MNEHYLLFFLLLVWTLFATIQDLKKREVANWLNFSLIAFALAYRAFYSTTTKNPQFFILGIAGFAISFSLAHAFYYGKVFAGGDAKLLMGFGAALPFTSYFSLITTTLIFIASLLTFGAIYSLLFSIFIVIKNKTKFKKEFSSHFKKYKFFLAISLILFSISLLAGIENSFYWIISPLMLSPFLLIYAKSLESCMIVLLPADKLTEGDWLEKEIIFDKNKKQSLISYIQLKNKEKIAEKIRNDLLIAMLEEISPIIKSANYLAKKREKKLITKYSLTESEIINIIAKYGYIYSKNPFSAIYRKIKYLTIKDSPRFTKFIRQIEELSKIKSEKEYKEKISKLDKNYFNADSILDIFNYHPSKIILGKSVHGISLKEIQLLKKHNKKVLIKQGVPFVPAFLISLLFMAPFFLTSKPALLSFLSSLFSPL